MCDTEAINDLANSIDDIADRRVVTTAVPIVPLFCLVGLEDESHVIRVTSLPVLFVEVTTSKSEVERDFVVLWESSPVTFEFLSDRERHPEAVVVSAQEALDETRIEGVRSEAEYFNRLREMAALVRVEKKPITEGKLAGGKALRATCPGSCGTCREGAVARNGDEWVALRQLRYDVVVACKCSAKLPAPAENGQ